MIDHQLQTDGDREHAETEQNALVPAVQASSLINYEAARRALAEAVRVDEVKAIHDQAAAMQAYAKIAKDKDMNAAELRLRAERNIGEMMKAQAETVGKAKGAKGIGTSAGYEKTRTADTPVTLAEAGIDKNLAHRSRRAAKLSAKGFEREVAEMRKGNRGSLDIRRAVNKKPAAVRRDDADRQADDGDQAQREAKFRRSDFLFRAEQASAEAQYRGPLQPGWADEFAALARNVAEKWTALAIRFEADRDAEGQAIASPANDEHERD
jgi:hypothetical protein